MKYNVYGIGNALVDMEFVVGDNFFDEMSIEKGLMTLVTHERQKELLNYLEGNDVKRSCGGSAANTMIAISQLGGNSFYSCKVASDDLGQYYRADLMKEGVQSNLKESLDEGVTGRCFVLVSSDADRTMNSFLGITQEFSRKELVINEIKNSNWLYVEGYLVTSPTAFDAVLEALKVAKSSGVKRAVTFSDPGIVEHFKDEFNKILNIDDERDFFDMIFCNEDEAYQFTKSDNIDDATEALKKVASGFVITLGANGACIYDGSEIFNVSTSKVTAVDTNGAGDMFAGAFLYAINHDRSYEEAGIFACQAASRLVTKFGARLKKSELMSIWLEGIDG